MFLFSLDKYPEVELLDHMIVLLLIFFQLSDHLLNNTYMRGTVLGSRDTEINKIHMVSALSSSLSSGRDSLITGNYTLIYKMQ